MGMKSIMRLFFAALTVLAFDACSSGGFSDDFQNADGNMNGGGQDNGGGGSTTAYDATIGDLTSFDIALNTESLNESDPVDADDEDYVENNTFDNQIVITYNSSAASVSGTVSGVTVTADGAYITVNSTVKGVDYVLKGSTDDGQFKIYSDKKYKLTLGGVSITCKKGPAVNSQCSKRAYIVLTDGTENTVSDVSSYATSEEDQKGTVFSEGELLLSGSGKLNVNANVKAGISSDDYVLVRPKTNISIKTSVGNGIKANEAVYIKGGVINISASGTAAKGLSSDSLVNISGGRTTVITTGGGEYDSDEKDATGSAGVKADYTFAMNGGELLLKSTGAGGKCISSDGTITVNDGTIKVITTGQKYTYGQYDTSPKGIKSDGNMTVNGGSVRVRATGGEGSEGVESKGTLTVNAGTVECYAYDDAINTAKAMTFAGGWTFAYSSGNDGIDSNSTITITGGTVVGVGTTQPEGGIDCDNNTINVSGGTVCCIGGSNSSPTSSSAKQPVLIVGASSLTAGNYLSLNNSDGTNIFAFKVPRAYNQYSVMLSSPSMKLKSSYTLTKGATVSGGTDFDGLLTGATVSGGSSVAAVTLSSNLTQSGTTSTGGGGGKW
jgi:hypothetical protein